MNPVWRKTLSPSARERGRVSDQDIVDHIRAAVLMQRLPPDTRLPEVTLGEVFGVSRSVVRKALTRLASEHVLDQRPNQVARVRAPTIEETRDTFAARRLVEGEAVALQAGSLDAKALDALSHHVEQEKLAYAKGDEPARIEHSLSFHHLLAEHAPNRILGSMLTDLIVRTSIVIALYKRPSLGSCYLEGDHPRLLESLQRGDAEAARAGVDHHLYSLENLLDLCPREAETDLMAIFGARS
ncbi:GntR family transcriptional regulator [Halomonas garicola]|uniref:GntR family transcriptional regulator n=1 Tax=Halomonas garicola TaxID=1690008 RepID=UPI0028A175F4|nr:GntR family transcriptional regulator [Halomonas garicola]